MPTAVTVDGIIDKGYIDADDEIVFYNHAEVCNLFGHNYQLFLRSIVVHPFEPGSGIWFPKFYEDDVWNNQLVEIGIKILEARVDGQNLAHIQRNINRPQYYRRLVFGAYEENRLRLYRFKGVFEFDQDASETEGVSVHKRIATRANLYPTA